MGRLGWLAGLLVCLGGCATAQQGLVREYSDVGFQQYAACNFAGARDSYLAALALRPEDPGLIYNVAQSFDHLGDACHAEQYYVLCLQRSPAHAACRHALAELYLRQGRRDNAVHLVQDWLAREPQRADAYVEDGWLWHQMGDLRRAQGRLQQALEIDPLNERAMVELASVYEGLNRPDLAVLLYTRALQEDPNQPEVARRLGQLQARCAPRPG